MVSNGISVVGVGYVGFCTAVGFASKANKVIAVDNNPKRVKTINGGVPPFYEQGLDEALQTANKNGYLQCTSDLEHAILNTDLTFVAVGTPSKADGSIDLTQIRSASTEIAKALNNKSGYHLVVVKSTVLPGTTENVVKHILEKYSNKFCGSDFGLCMNPEFLQEGAALQGTLHPDRVVIGEFDKKSGDLLESLYSRFYAEQMPPILRMNLATAELVKYANNAFLATKISYINSIANICEKVKGTDVKKVAEAIGYDSRISPRFLRAGLGYGGSCFPKDLKALIAFSKQNGITPTMLQSTHQVNEDQVKHAVELAKKQLGKLANKKIAVLGLAFKPETDDLREANSIQLINLLLAEGAKVTAYDPVAIPNTKAILKDKIGYAKSTVECLQNADCCILVTEWNEFKQLKPEDFEQNMKQPILIDGRRIYDPKKFAEKLRFSAIGLGQ